MQGNGRVTVGAVIKQIHFAKIRVGINGRQAGKGAFTFAFFFLSILAAFFREYLKNVGKDPEESKKIEAIKKYEMNPINKRVMIADCDDWIL